jgi:hypothetical protein
MMKNELCLSEGWRKSILICFRQYEVLQVADLDVYLSFTNPEPRFVFPVLLPHRPSFPSPLFFSGYSLLSIDDYDWAGHNDDDDSITLVNICSPTGEVPWPIYLSSYTWKGKGIEEEGEGGGRREGASLAYFAGDQVGIRITATTKNTFIRRPIKELPATQVPFIFTNGQFQLECQQDDTDQFELIRCQSAQYPGRNLHVVPLQLLPLNLPPASPPSRQGKRGRLVCQSRSSVSSFSLPTLFLPSSPPLLLKVAMILTIHGVLVPESPRSVRWQRRTHGESSPTVRSGI